MGKPGVEILLYHARCMDIPFQMSFLFKQRVSHLFDQGNVGQNLEAEYVLAAYKFRFLNYKTIAYI